MCPMRESKGGMDMKCHYVYDKKAGRVLIPGCWPVVHSNDIRDCTCTTHRPSESEEISKLKKEIRLLKKQIKELKDGKGTLDSKG